MAENAGARFYEGLRVTADHLRHMQDRLWEAVGDLRLALGRGRIAWGLRADLVGGAVVLSPGVAFSSEGIRLAIDTETVLNPPPGTGPFLLRLSPVNEDRTSLQLGGVPTYVTLRAEAAVIPEADAPVAPETLDIARIASPQSDDSTTSDLVVAQNEDLFIAAGHHGHSGTFSQDTAGRWFYDGPVLPDIATLNDQLAAIDGILTEIDSRLVSLEELPALVTELQEQALSEEDLRPLSEQLVELQGQLADLPDLSALSAITDELQTLAGLVNSVQRLVDLLPDIQRIAGLLTRISAVETGLEQLESAVTGLANRVSVLEQSGGPDGDGGLDPNWPMIKATNWPHGNTLPPDRAAEHLTEVIVDFSEPLSGRSRETGGQMFQVWFEPNPSPDSRTFAQPILTLPGQGRSRQDNQITWITIAPFQGLLDLFKSGGRLILRVHCGALMSEDGRAFSASTVALTDIAMPPVPGGVMESWFFVNGG